MMTTVKSIVDPEILFIDKHEVGFRTGVKRHGNYKHTIFVFQRVVEGFETNDLQTKWVKYEQIEKALMQILCLLCINEQQREHEQLLKYMYSVLRAIRRTKC